MGVNVVTFNKAMRAPQAMASALLVLLPSGAGAESPPMLELANSPGFTERFAGNTQVSGQFLSGLAYSTVAALNLKDLRLAFSRAGGDDPDLICVRLATDDGRYWASNLYRAKDSFDTPPSVPVPTSYEDQLREYGADGLLVLATLSDDCRETSGKTYVPGLLGPGTHQGSLVAYVNVSQSRVSASLEDGDGTVLQKTSCKKPAEGTKVTYSHLCQFPVTDLAKAGTYKLKVSVKGLTGKATEQEYAVHLE